MSELENYHSLTLMRMKFHDSDPTDYFLLGEEYNTALDRNAYNFARFVEDYVLFHPEETIDIYLENVIFQNSITDILRKKSLISTSGTRFNLYRKREFALSTCKEIISSAIIDDKYAIPRANTVSRIEEIYTYITPKIDDSKFLDITKKMLELSLLIKDFLSYVDLDSEIKAESDFISDSVSDIKSIPDSKAKSDFPLSIKFLNDFIPEVMQRIKSEILKNKRNIDKLGVMFYMNIIYSLGLLKNEIIWRNITKIDSFSFMKNTPTYTNIFNNVRFHMCDWRSKLKQTIRSNLDLIDEFSEIYINLKKTGNKREFIYQFLFKIGTIDKFGFGFYILLKKEYHEAILKACVTQLLDIFSEENNVVKALDSFDDFPHLLESMKSPTDEKTFSVDITTEIWYLYTTMFDYVQLCDMIYYSIVDLCSNLDSGIF